MAPEERLWIFLSFISILYVSWINCLQIRGRSADSRHEFDLQAGNKTDEDRTSFFSPHQLKIHQTELIIGAATGGTLGLLILCCTLCAVCGSPGDYQPGEREGLINYMQDLSKSVIGGIRRKFSGSGNKSRAGSAVSAAPPQESNPRDKEPELVPPAGRTDSGSSMAPGLVPENERPASATAGGTGSNKSGPPPTIANPTLDRLKGKVRNFRDVQADESARIRAQQAEAKRDMENSRSRSRGSPNRDPTSGRRYYY